MEIYKNTFKTDSITVIMDSITVNSSILFNIYIYTKDMEKFNLNQPDILRQLHRSDCLFDGPFKIQQSLQNIFHKLEFYFKT